MVKVTDIFTIYLYHYKNSVNGRYTNLKKLFEIESTVLYNPLFDFV